MKEIVDTTPYRKLVRNQLLVGMFPAIALITSRISRNSLIRCREAEQTRAPTNSGARLTSEVGLAPLFWFLLLVTPG